MRKRGTRYDYIAFAPETDPPAPPAGDLDEMFRRLHLPAARPGHRLALETDPKAARDTLRRFVTEARTSLDIVLYRLDPDPFTEAFMADLDLALARGVKVRMILDHMGTLIQRPRAALKAFTKPANSGCSRPSQSFSPPAGSTCATTARW
ncbi:MAG: hypothetical protein R3D59_18465 [Paracoccaceae bacterium]